MSYRILTSLALVCVVVVVWLGCSEDKPLAPAGNPAVTPDVAGDAALAIGPIEGLTTAWHRAPERTAVPLGTTVRFRCAARPGQIVVWQGAVEVDRTSTFSLAECPMTAAGLQRMQVEVFGELDKERRKPDGDGAGATASNVYECVLNVIDVPVSDIKTRMLDVTAAVTDLDDAASNDETMKHFFGPSIAALTRVADDHYRTSVGKPLQVRAALDPVELSPLAEVRVDGRPVGLEKVDELTLRDIGAARVSAGPPARSRDVTIDLYSAHITSHTNGVDVVSDGELHTFKAVTDPPGYEADITWLASTKYGGSSVVMGQGPEFTVRFSDTWNQLGNGYNFQWLGVKADNTAFNQDNKLPPPDQFLLIAPNMDNDALLDGSTTISIVAAGDLNSPHTINWSTDNPNVTVSPSSSVVDFIRTGQVIDVTLMSSVPGDSAEATLLADIVGELNNQVQKVFKFFQAAAPCKIIATRKVNGIVQESAPIKGPVTKLFTNASQSGRFVSWERTVHDDGTALRVGTTVGGFDGQKTIEIVYTCSPDSVCVGPKVCNPIISVGAAAGQMFCSCP